MATQQRDGSFIIAAGEVGAYTVCPESWKLKWIDRERPAAGAASTKRGLELHQRWSDLFDEEVLFGRWSRYVATLVCSATLIFLLLQRPRDPFGRMFDMSSPGTIFELLLVVCAAVIVIRLLLGAAKGRTEATGLSSAGSAVSVDGSNMLPGREYISLVQGLAGKPDAILIENGFRVPVERKPLAKKLRDRYVAQLLVYMRLVEEFEGYRPPHGYLVLGPKCRRVRVENTEEKQRWLDGLLTEMRGVLSGHPTVPSPHPAKCAKCDVRQRCSVGASGYAHPNVSPTKV